MQRNTAKSEYLAIKSYEQIEKSASDHEKDILIKALLQAVADNDLNGTEILASEVQNAVIGEWISVQNIKANDISNTEIASKRFLLKYFPKAISIISADEVVLLAELAKKISASFSGITLGVRKPLKSSILEIWLICEKKDYKILENATDVSYEYLLKTRKDVNFVFISNKQLKSQHALEFLIQFEI